MKISRGILKTPYERRFGEPFKGPIIPFGSLVEHHPTQEYSSVMFCTRRESGKETYWLWTLRSWKRWTHQNSIRNQPIRGESHQDLFGGSEGSPPIQHFQDFYFRMPVKHEMISGPLRETSFTVITLNHESNSTRRGKNHFLFH